MIERSITQYLANHNRRKEAPSTAPVWAPSFSGRTMLDGIGADIEDIAPPGQEPGFEAPSEPVFAPLIEEAPELAFTPYSPERPQAIPAAQQELIEAHVQQERENWVALESQRLHEQIISAFDTLENHISDQVARILQPFVQEAMTHLAITALVQRIDAVLSGENAPVLRLSGPQDLLEAVQMRLGDRAASVTCVVAPHADVQVLAGALRMETSLAEWANALRAATGLDDAGKIQPDEGQL